MFSKKFSLMNNFLHLFTHASIFFKRINNINILFILKKIHTR